jgi:cytochrome b6-f complex iron-sulfur subunit
VTTLALTTATIAVIVVMLALIMFSIFFGLSFLRVDRAQRAATLGDLGQPSKPVKVVSRRDFFRRSMLTSLLVFGAEFGGGTIGFLWPNLKGGFGSQIAAGSHAGNKQQMQSSGGQPVYNGTGRFYIIPWDGTAASGQADYAGEGVTAQGIMPLYQRCVHLGCRVPFCNSSKWFECPCHGSKYNQAGEYQLGPAPRGMDRFKVTITGDTVVVDTSAVVLGPPRGTDTISEPPQGPFCVAPG